MDKIGRVIVLLMSTLMLWTTSTKAASVLQAIRITAQTHSARIVLEVKGQLNYQTLTLNSPDRLVIDLPNTTTAFNPQQLNYPKKLIRNVRFGSQNDSNLRIVFDLQQAAKNRVYVLGHTNQGMRRLVADLSIPNQVVTETKQQPQPPLPVSRKMEFSKENPVPIMTVPKEKMRDVVVTIDPGHGGKDPGAIGANGTREKNVVLAISQELVEQINRQPGMHAVLTREGDYYIGLRQRLTAARKHNADLFIAIHADAYNKRDSIGASVFALSPHGASSEAARWLAERENHSELGDVPLNDKSLMLRSVLLDLSQTATIIDSLHLGDQVLHNLRNMTKLHNLKVEQAPFMVLKSPDIPSILIETGFITNPEEEIKLSDPHYRETLASAITNGIKSYFWAHPPNGTIFSVRSKEVV